MTFDFSKLHSLLSQSIRRNQNTSCENMNALDNNVPENEDVAGSRDIVEKMLDAVEASEREGGNLSEISRKSVEKECGRSYEDPSDILSETEIEFNVNNLAALLLWNIGHIGMEKHEFHLCNDILLTLINILNRTVEIMKQEKNCQDPVIWEVINPDNGPIVSFKYFQFNRKATLIKVVKEEPVEDRNSRKKMTKNVSETNSEPIFKPQYEFIELDHNEILIPVEGEIIDEAYDYRTNSSPNNLTKHEGKNSENTHTVVDSQNELTENEEEDLENANSVVDAPKSTSLKARSAKFHKNSRKDIQCCAVCSRAFASDVAFKLHASKHTSVKCFQCSICHKRFLTFNHLRNHNIHHHRSTTKRLRNHRLSYSNKNTSKMKQIENVLNRIRTSSRVNFKHKTQGKDTIRLNSDKTLFKKSSSEKIQKNQNHKNILNSKQFFRQCKFCHQAFHYRRNLVQHERIHFTSPKTHKCVDCSKFFTTNCDLEKHRSSHTGEKLHACALCTQQRISYVWLNPVSQKIVSGECFDTPRSSHINPRDYMIGKAYSCDICFKIFTTSCELQCHKYFHANGKQLSCSQCIQTRIST